MGSYSLGGCAILLSPKGVARLGVAEVEASITASASAGGNWLFGGSNDQIVLQASEIQGGNAGYNLAYGIAEISLTMQK